MLTCLYVYMKKGLILVFSTAIISGFSIFINKYSVSVIDPYVFTFLKNGLVALMLCVIIAAVKERQTLKNLTKKQWFLLLTIGLIGGAIPFLLFFKGLALTSAAQGGFIHKTMFIYILILAAIFLKEKISKNFLIGALLLLLGSLLTLKKLPVSFGRGDILVFLAAIFWAIENVISKYVLRNLSGKITAWGRMFFGSIFIAIYLGLSGQLSLLEQLTFRQIGWTIITAVLLFGYVITWYSGLKHISVSLAAAVLMLGSPITTALAFASGTKIAPKDIASGLLILAGLIFILSVKYLFEQWKRLKEKKQCQALN